MSTTNYFEVLEPGNYYHVFNKSVGSELLFRKEKDYFFFIEKLKRFILPFVEIYSYCLIPNHFHLLIRINELNNEENIIEKVNQSFSNFFNSYSRSYNNTYSRTGKLFNLPYRRIHVKDEDYFTWLICYIHRNPIHHYISKNYQDYPYSSYKDIISGNGFIKVKEVIDWFGNKQEFIDFHQLNIDVNNEKGYLID